MKKLLPRAHWDRPTSVVDARNYCRKGHVIRDEDNRRQGHRSDLAAVAQKVIAGQLSQVISEHPEVYVKYSKGLLALDSVSRSTVEKVKPWVAWFFGATGTGKTKTATELCSPGEQYLIITKSGPQLWFDGYRDQEVVIFDDFREDFCSFSFLLNLLDRYKM